MSVKIWCEECTGSGNGNKYIPDPTDSNQGTLVIINNGICPTCHGLGYEERGCGNCDKHEGCNRILDTGDGAFLEEIDYCTAWEAGQ